MKRGGSAASLEWGIWKEFMYKLNAAEEMLKGEIVYIPERVFRVPRSAQISHGSLRLGSKRKS